MWKRLKDFILQDVDNENEIKMYAIILRMTLSVMFLYYGISLGSAVIMLRRDAAIGAVAGLVLCACLFRQTYRDRIRLTALIFNLSFTVLILVHAIMFGNRTSIFHFVYVQIVLLYALNYLSLKWNVFCVALLVAFRMGAYNWVERTGALYPVNDGELVFWQGMHLLVNCILLVIIVSVATQDFREMQEKLVSYNRKLKNIASVDPLTGLRNRRSVMEYLGKELESYRSGEASALTIAIGDIDFFKRVNDTYGHNYGDLVLKTLADTFKHFMKGRGRVARWGGEEFLFIFHDTNGDNAAYMLGDLRNELHGMDFKLGSDLVKITMTFGVSEYDPRKEVEDTIEDADRKLYQGKKSGRDKVVY